ncbi:hypothetical protein D3C72_1852390 [compost metagenome]
MIEALGKGADLGAAGRDGFGAVRPADGRGDVHRREQGLVGFRELGGRPGAVGDLQAGGFATGGEPSR